MVDYLEKLLFKIWIRLKIREWHNEFISQSIDYILTYSNRLNKLKKLFNDYKNPLDRAKFIYYLGDIKIGEKLNDLINILEKMNPEERKKFLYILRYYDDIINPSKVIDALKSDPNRFYCFYNSFSFCLDLENDKREECFKKYCNENELEELISTIKR